jgi:ATP-binding protein involved in chromosome partitioning
MHETQDLAKATLGKELEVRALLEEIRPAIQMDGGDVEFVSLDDKGKVMVRLLGSCVGCHSPSSPSSRASKTSHVAHRRRDLRRRRGSLVSLTEARILEALQVVQDPDLHKDLVALGMIEDVRIDGGNVSFTVALTTPACPVKDDLKRQCEEAVRALPGVTSASVTMTSRVRGRSGGVAGKVAIPGVAHVVAVASGKGGVGKSTVAVNLAVALAQDGARVGLIDADVYGPNVPLMMGVREQPYQKDGKILPLSAHGVKVMSMGFLVDPETPVIWRGPMLHGVMQNFTRDVDWGTLDYLVIDMPPGTGDVQLSLAQQVPLAGAVIVATPQQVALDDAQKAIAMFKKLEVPVLGCDREHVLLHLPVATPATRSSPRRRRGQGESARFAVFGRDPDPSVRPPGRRRGGPGARHRSLVSRGRGVSLGRAPGGVAAVHPGRGRHTRPRRFVREPR